MRNWLFLVSIWTVLHTGCDGESGEKPLAAENDPPVATADTLTFADAGLEEAVRAALGQPEGPLTREDGLSLTQLDASQRGIIDLTGIDQLGNLTSLVLMDNQVQELTSLAELTRLQFLNLAGNQVEDISLLANLTQLKYLILENNQVEDISPLLGLEQLESVELSGNSLDQKSSAHIEDLRAKGISVTIRQPLEGPAANEENPAPSGPQILFSSNRSGNYDIFTMGADGSDVEQLTSDPADDRQPAWAPDRSQIAFVRGHSGSGDIIILDLLNLTERSLTSGIGDNRDPAWAPDGTRIVFCRSTRDRPVKDLHIAAVDGSSVERLTEFPNSVQQPTWAPDGKKIACVSRKKGVSYETLFIYHLESGEVSELTDAGNPERAPDWSPDGQFLLFTADTMPGSRYSFQVFLRTLDGSTRNQLTDEYDTHPTWSPDGERFAFVRFVFSDSGPNSDIFSTAINDFSPINLTHHPAHDADPDW
ncbi:MAG: hypothetical protein HOC74_34255 [Gemmatimonadetes bacterium]|jgi:WD40 repeat protein|nr:hypothetical protein [Gemmatimonadota bacterium]